MSKARRPPDLKRTADRASAADPFFAAGEQTRAALGLQFWFSGDPLAELDLSSVTEEDIGDLSLVFPSEEDLAVLRSVKPNYRLPSLQERTRRFLSEFLLCSSLIEYEATSRKMYQYIGSSTPPLGNLEYWKTRCRAVVAVISALPPSREKSLLTLRYVNGHSIEACAPLLGVSRRTAYRIHSKAISMASHVLLRRR